MLVVGIDPDSQATGFAVIEDEGGGRPRVIVCGVTPSPKGQGGMVAVEHQLQELREMLPSLPPCDYAAAEYPQSYQSYYKRGKPQNVDPNHLIMLSALSGASLVLVDAPKKSLVRPAEWKGQRSKGATQRQVCRILGWTWDQPSNADNPMRAIHPLKDTKILGWAGDPSKYWSEVLDACGIALYEIRRRKGVSYE